MFLRYLPHAAEPPAPLAGGRAAAWDLNPGRGPVPAPVAPAPRPLVARGGATAAPVRLSPPSARYDRQRPAQGPSRAHTVRPLTPANDAGTDLGSETTA